MRIVLRRLCAEHDPAVLFITHDVEETLVLADRVLLLEGGHIVLDQPVELPSPRRTTSVEFQTARAALLAALGVTQDASEASGT